MAPTVEDIVDILGEMRLDEAKNSDILKTVFADFKKSIEEKHSFTVDKFQELEASFNKIIKKQGEFSKTKELKELFEVFQQHVNVIENDVKEQQSELKKLEKTIKTINSEKLGNKDFEQKSDDIVSSIVAITENLKVYDNFAKDATKNITEKLEELTTKEENVELKATVREVVTKTDNIIDALKFFNEKTENLANAIQNLIASDDYIKSQETIYQIAEKTNEISAVIENFPIKSDVENVSSKLDEISTLYDKKFDEINSVLQNCINDLITSTKTDDIETRKVLQDKLIEFHAAVAANSHSFADKMDEFKTKVSESFTAVVNASSESAEKTNLSLLELSDIKNELDEIIKVVQNLSPSFDTKSSEIIEIIEKNLQPLVGEIINVKTNLENCLQTSTIQGSLDSILYRFDEVTSTLNSLKSEENEDTKNVFTDIDEKINGLKQEFNLVVTDILANITAKSDYIENSISNLKNEFSNILSFDFSKYFDEVKAQIEMSFLNVGSDISRISDENKEFKNNIDNNLKDLHSKLDSFDEFIKSEIQGNVELLRFTFESFSKSIEASLIKTSDFISNWEEEVNKIKCLTEDIKATLATKLDDCCIDLKSFINDNENTSKTIDVIDSLKLSISENFDNVITHQNNFKAEVKENIQNVLDAQNDKTKEAEIIKNEVENLGTTLKNFVTEACENSLNRVDETIKNVNALGTMVDNNDEIVNVIENIKNILSKEIAEKLNAYTTIQDEKLEKIKADINSYVYTEQIEDEKAKILDEIFTVKTENNLNKEILNIVEQLEKRVNAISAKNPANDYVKSISELTKKSIFEELDKIKKELVFCVSESQSSLNDLTDSISKIDDDIYGLSEDITNLNSNVVNISDKIENLAKSDSQLAQTLEALHSKVDILALDENEFDIEAEIDDIKDLIATQLLEGNSDKTEECFNKLLEEMNTLKNGVSNDDVKESIISAIVSVFEQISFIEETEEIKDFVEEKTDLINEKLQKVQEQLQQIATGETTDYSYTLQDVESDIAKLRIAMNEVTNSAPQQTLIELRENIEKVVQSVENMQSSLSDDEIVDLKNDFVKLSEDMVSISTRTNKLLLTSDEAYKTLSDGLDRFGGLIYKLEDKIQFPDTTEINERIEKKVDNLNVLVNNSVANDQIFHQVMQYLGEWMDSVSESINSISEKTTCINSIKDITEELKYALPQKTELIEELEQRFDAQELRIDRLEMKLDNILLAVEEKTDSLISKKLDKLEKQIAKLGINVEKLASYVDEE